MISARIRSLNEYLIHRKNNAHVYKKIQEIEENLAKNNKRKFTVKGYSYPAQKEVKFEVDYLYSDDVHINWRERVTCPETKLNNRLRASVHFMDFELSVDKNSAIYIAEQLTPLYSYLKKKHTHLVGSEYLGPDATPGSVNKKGILHEDATRLSFNNVAFDYYLSFECFEHIPAYKKAFQESYRILKENGMMFWTVPFANQNHENIIRATVNNDGSINHILPAEYHGDPVNSGEGILCYQHFGCEMFDQLKEIGFKDAYAISYWCDALGYYGGEQFLFCAVK